MYKSARYKTGLYWFTNDLRVSDNPTLAKACELSEKLICVFVLDPRFRQANVPQTSGLPSIMGAKRYQFLHETLMDLSSRLERRGQRLHLVYEPPVRTLDNWCRKFQVDAVFRSQNAGYYENHHWSALQRRLPDLNFFDVSSHTLFTEDALPFRLPNLPSNFSKFRNLVEPLSSANEPYANRSGLLSATLPPPPLLDVDFLEDYERFPKPEPETLAFTGGESQAQKHLADYAAAQHPSRYKEVRNQLDGWENSTKLSPWLANGSLSAQQVVKAVHSYEADVEANDSTYWILFELLWREYFQWYAHAYQARLFTLRGIKNNAVLNGFYPSRFLAWCQGNTPYPLVNACMKQLNATGYMSNRGRQIVASCFVNELELDWRYGAAYFEEQLIDYDVAVNWGNWQYQAGVGADPRGKRRFDLDKQANIYDKDHAFRKKWGCASLDDSMREQPQLDMVDAADWPLD